MNDRSMMLLGAIIGAGVGASVGFVLFTERGRRLRNDLQPEIETVVREAMRLGQVIDELRDRKSTRLNSSHLEQSRMPSSA